MIKWLLRIAVFSSTITIAALVVIYYGFQASLPDIEGDINLTGITSSVSIDRDQQGGATISGQNRDDLGQK